MASILDSFTMITNEEMYLNDVYTITVREHIVGLRKETVDALGRPDAVMLLINSKAKQVAIKACDRNTPGATKVVYSKGNTAYVSATAFSKTVVRLAGLEKDKYPVWFSGEFIPEEQAFIFDLTKPMFNLCLKGTGRRRRS